MAFVTRSRRETEIAIEQASTTPLVGPGAYCNLGSYSTDHGYAPFSSTERRGLADGGETSVDLKPGPGFYAREVVEPAVMRKASSNAFVSKVSRFAREVSTSKRSPGPGTYVESNMWLNKSYRQDQQPTSRNIMFKHIPSAPSVPARNQCYGYDVGHDGELLKQPAPGGQYTGHKHDAVGPGDYDPQFTLMQNMRNTDFSRSGTQRHIFKPKSTPGPGQYQADSSVTSMDSGYVTVPVGDGSQKKTKMLPSQSSNFASKVPRMPGEKAENQTPGPGSYKSGALLLAHSKTSAAQNFGSTAKRSYEVDTATQLAAPTSATTPGPGAYDLRKAAVLMSQTLYDPAPFASTSLRFGDVNSNFPGPGAYYSQSTEGLVSDLNRKIVARNGAFGCSTQRFASPKSNSSYLYMGNDESPGPGTYVPEIALRLAGGKVQKKATSSFASNVSRFSKKQKPKEGKTEDMRVSTTPPPGAYSTVDPWDWAKKSRGQGRTKAFISKAQRFKTSQKSTRAAEPGPGSYETGANILSPKSVGDDSRKHFVSSASRFGRTSTLAPGPGTYDTEDPERTMIRRSFNVTIDGAELS